MITFITLWPLTTFGSDGRDKGKQAENCERHPKQSTFTCGPKKCVQGESLLNCMKGKRRLIYNNLPNLQQSAPLSVPVHLTSTLHFPRAQSTDSECWTFPCCRLALRVFLFIAEKRSPEPFAGNTTLLWVPYNTHTALLRLQTAEV